MLTQPTPRQSQPPGIYQRQHKTYIDDHRCDSYIKGTTRVAGSHDGRQKDVARHSQQVGGKQDVERRSAGLDTGGIGRIYTQHGLGKQGSKEQHGHHQAIGHRDGATKKQRDRMESTTADKVAGQRAGSCRQRADGYKENGEVDKEYFK